MTCCSFLLWSFTTHSIALSCHPRMFLRNPDYSAILMNAIQKCWRLVTPDRKET